MLSNLLNKPGGRITKSQQSEVLQLIRDNDRSITVVDCGKELEDDFVADLCRAITVNRFVTTLRIRDKSVAPAIDALSALCKQTTTLVNLKISYANLTDDDAQCLCLALLKNKSVQSLALDHNRLTSAAAIVMLLTHNKTLDSIDLSFNNLGAGGDPAMASIADALGKSTTLKQLYLSGNGMSDTAARGFVACVDQNLHTMQLRVLDIAAENSVRSETKQAMKLILEAGRKTAAASSKRTDDGDDLRSNLAGLGFHNTTASAVDANDTEGISADDVKSWQEQVESNVRYDEERKELAATIDRLRHEKDQMATAQIAALELTNRLQQQVVLLTERSVGLQRDLDTVTAKYDRKVKESSDQISTLQTQVANSRKELVRVQEMAATDRANLVGMQESLTQELSVLNAQLSAATKANDFLDTIGGGARPKGLSATVGTTTEGLPTAVNLSAKNSKSSAGPPTAQAVRSPRRSDEDDLAWSANNSADGDGARNQGSSSKVRCPTPMPKDQWVDDDAADDCRSCRNKFTLTRRKHHCRLCGQLFCNRCASLHKQWDLRVCTYCIATHN